MIEPLKPSSEILFAFWRSIETDWNFWNGFRDILVCPHTAEGARYMFPDARIRVVRSYEDLNDFLCIKRMSHDLGILSPWILVELDDFSRGIKLIAEHMDNSLGIVIGFCGPDQQIARRRMIHAAGYYEVATLRFVHDSVCYFEDSSVGWLPSGEFSLWSDQPGLRVDALSCVSLFATKTAQNNSGPRPWTSVVGCLKMNLSGDISGRHEALALCVTPTPIVSGKSNSLSAVFQWWDSSSGHASLVGCYAGPDDQNMYASLLQPNGRGSARVSLWRQLETWKELQAFEVATNVRGDISLLEVSMVISSRTIHVICDGRPLIQQDDQTLPRTSRSGVRMNSDDLLISNIEFRCL